MDPTRSPEDGPGPAGWRRVDRIVVEVGAGGTRCVVEGAVGRHVVRRPVPLALGLRWGAAGTPVRLVHRR